MYMNKKKILLSVAAVASILLCGCTIKNESEEAKKNEEVKREPSFAEIAKEVVNNTSYFSRMKAVLEVKLAAFKDVEISDVKEFKDRVSTIYAEAPCEEVGNKYICKSIAQIGLLECQSATTDENDPIVIVKDAILTNGKTRKKVNLVLLQGTDLSDGQATGIKEDILSGMSLSNEYLYDAYYAVYNNIKDTNTPLYFSGISLGGMVAQQLSGLSYIKNYYTVSNVVSLASPILAQDDINYDVTTVRRMVDTNDIVPTLSTQENGSYESKYGDKNKALVKTGNYKTFIGTHVFSYVEKDGIFKDVDVLGNEFGGYYFEIDKNKITKYPAEKFEQTRKKLYRR